MNILNENSQMLPNVGSFGCFFCKIQIFLNENLQIILNLVSFGWKFLFGLFLHNINILNENLQMLPNLVSFGMIFVQYQYLKLKLSLQMFPNLVEVLSDSFCTI